jgi:TolA-binding protein
VKRARALRIILPAVLASLCGAADARDDAPQAGTARDLIIKADRAYNEKRPAEAVAGYQAFLRDFGASEEARPDLPHVRYNLAAALMQTQKFDAAVAAIGEAQEFDELSPEKKENLAFWRGVAVLQLGDNEEALAALDDFIGRFPRSRRREDAALMAATALMVGGKTKEAAGRLSALRGNPESVHRGRAAVLELHSLLEAGQNEAALELIAAEAPRQERLTQIATFQTLALGLGGKYLEDEKPREAIRALQAVWPHARLVAHQQRRLEEVRERLADLELRPSPDIFERSQARQVAREVGEELKNLEKIPSFDASVRFRLASAFHQQGRFRECALLLDDMLHGMPPDPVVEQASLTALQSWMALGRYDKAAGSAERFAGRFPRSKQLPLVLYLQGVARQQAREYDAAQAVFRGVVEKFPSSEQAPRAFFMQAFTQLLAENNEEAAELFAVFRKKYPDDELGESAAYWQGSALAFSKKFPEARAVLAALPAEYPQGALLGPAAFRHAYCAQSMREYGMAEEELKAYLREYPDGEESAEARILLGDALLAQAKSDEGKEVYAAVPPEAGRFHEEAQFKLAKVLRLEEDYGGLRALMQSYLEKYPNSPRAAEALFLIGTAWRQEDQRDKAKEEYWAAIRRFGHNPDAHSVEDLFLALSRLYQGEAEKLDYLADLRTLRAQAEAEDQTVLTVRTIWALAQAVKKSDPGLSQALLREASVLVAPAETSPAVMSDCAEAQILAAAAEADPSEATRRRELAAGLYRDLLKWHPRAPQKDQALGALAKLALEQDDVQTALDYYARIERDVPWSPLMGDVLSTRARLEVAEGRLDEAVDSYTRLLGAGNVPGKLKAQALLALGELEMQRNQPTKAIPYYQRIYILYGKWRDAVAQAYLRSGEAFEQINDLEAARRTYEELANSEDLASLPEAEQAREKLKKFAPATEASS